jgi:hypothetical protein
MFPPPVKNSAYRYSSYFLFYLHWTYLYQKDERALPGNLRSRKSKFMFPPSRKK